MQLVYCKKIVHRNSSKYNTSYFLTFNKCEYTSNIHFLVKGMVVIVSNKIPNSIDGITKSLELLDEQFAYLEQNESNMTWESYDKAYTELLVYQTELVQRQAEYSSGLLEGYSDQLKELTTEINEESKVKSPARVITNTIGSGIKKGAIYAWNNKEKWHSSLMEKGQEQKNKLLAEKDKFLAEKDKAIVAVERHSTEQVKNNAKKILNKKQNEEVISTYERFYLQAAKEKIQG